MKKDIRDRMMAALEKFAAEAEDDSVEQRVADTARAELLEAEAERLKSGWLRRLPGANEAAKVVR